jgi:hypothetical protein
LTLHVGVPGRPRAQHLQQTEELIPLDRVHAAVAHLPAVFAGVEGDAAAVADIV